MAIDVADAVTEPTTDPGDDAPRKRGRLPRAIGKAWRWFGDFRRTRPFWGGLWLILGGWVVMSYTVAPIVVTLSAGPAGMAGYLLGGGMMALGLLAWFVPSQKTVAGLIGTAFAVASFVAANLGGFLVGMLLGILGGTMVFGWGPKKPRRRDRRKAAEQAAELTPPDHAEEPAA